MSTTFWECGKCGAQMDLGISECCVCAPPAGTPREYPNLTGDILRAIDDYGEAIANHRPIASSLRYTLRIVIDRAIAAALAAGPPAATPGQREAAEAVIGLVRHSEGDHDSMSEILRCSKCRKVQALRAVLAAAPPRAPSEPDPETPKIGERVAFFREQKGLSQSGLARIVGASQSAISQIESGDRNPSYGMLVQLADGCGVSLAHLVGAGENAKKIIEQGESKERRGEYAAFRAAPPAGGLPSDTELLDWLDTLPCGISIPGDRDHPQDMGMTPKQVGFSHTRDLIRQAMRSRAVPSGPRTEEPTP